jgi:pimeloyl-ACP methyl ester carboxylesterase
MERSLSSVEMVDEGTGGVIMLLHAFPCDHSMWDDQRRMLVDAGWRVLVPDLPGFGGSELPSSSDPDLGSVVELLVAAALDRGVDRLVVAGLSVGGYLVMEWLRRYPEMIAGIVLCDTKATADAQPAQDNRRAMAQAIDDDPHACGVILKERVLPVIVGSTTHDSRPNVVARVTSWMDRANPEAIAWYQRAMADRPNSVDTLAAVDIPALVLWGGEDAMSPEGEQQVMFDALRDAGSAMIPAAGHLSAIEQPEAVGRELVGFVTRVQRAGLSG